MKSIFIFRRDFRIYDNKGLIECCENSDEVLLLFIFTPEQVKNNEYFSPSIYVQNCLHLVSMIYVE